MTLRNAIYAWEVDVTFGFEDLLKRSGFVFLLLPHPVVNILGFLDQAD
jgi:hypothetical protein